MFQANMAEIGIKIDVIPMEIVHLLEKQIDQGRAIVNQEARKRVYFHAQLIAQWEAPGFVMDERPILYGAAQSVQGFKPDVRQLTRFEDVWLKR